MGKTFVVSEHCYATAPSQGVFKIPGKALYCGCPPCRSKQGVKWTEKVPPPPNPLEQELREALRRVKNGYADASKNNGTVRSGASATGRMRTGR